MTEAPRVFLSAGHELGGGAGANGLRENPYTANVGVLAVRELRDRGVEAWLTPLTARPYPAELRFRTAWIRARARPHDLAVEIHMDIERPGAAAFAIERPDALHVADVFADRIARASGLWCRGGRPERESAPGSLGFLRMVGCRAVLVELCSMNTPDARFARTPGARARFARGLADASCEVLEAERHPGSTPRPARDGLAVSAAAAAAPPSYGRDRARA